MMFFASISTVDSIELFSNLYLNVLFVIEKKNQHSNCIKMQLP